MARSGIDRVLAPIEKRAWLRRPVGLAVALGLTIGIAAWVFVRLQEAAADVGKATTTIGEARAAFISAPAEGALAIDSPLDAASVPVTLNGDRSGAFEVSGRASGIADGATVYLLVRPTYPAAREWWVMPDLVIDGDRWTGVAYIGNTQYPPVTGNRYALRVVMAAKGFQNGQSFLDLAQMKPLAQSKIVFVTAGTIR